MKVGVFTEPFIFHPALKHIPCLIERTLGENYEIVNLPENYIFSPASRQEALLESFLDQCDFIIGCLDSHLLEVRDRMRKPVPLIAISLGSLSSGGFDLAGLIKYLKTTDVLTVSCRADLNMAAKIFLNAQTRLLPFPFDEEVFYQVDRRSKTVLRRSLDQELGLRSEERVLVYAGRLALDKNLHTLLKVFSVVQRLIPYTTLLIAGLPTNLSFVSSGVSPLNFGNTLKKLVKKLNIPEERVRLAGQQTGSQLRSWYNRADLVVNMTIHHGENFGLAQVEAMACGAPVIGTQWGGLKDTIVDHQTGYHVKTVVTDYGVKVDWWEAIDRIVYLLSHQAEQRRMRKNCRSYAVEHYSPEKFRQNLDSIISECLSDGAGAGESICQTAFAEQLWAKCGMQPGTLPPLRRGAEPYRLYREYIGLYASEECQGEVQPGAMLCLAMPVVMAEGKVVINDPVYPFEVELPVLYRETCLRTLRVMEKRPVIEAGRLVGDYLRDDQEAYWALAWMVKAGILLRSGSGKAKINPEEMSEEMSTPLFSIQYVDLSADVLAYQ